MQQQTEQSVITIEQRKKIRVTGVESVDSFSESCVALTVEGRKLRIAGNQLKIVAFSKENGNFAAIGEISGIRYGAKGKAVSRLFR